MTHRQTWCDLHLPLVVVADAGADGGEITITRRAVGDSVTSHGRLQVLPDAGQAANGGVARAMQLTLFPWFSADEQHALAATLHRCGITDCSLNWFDHGLPLLPTAAYAAAATTLRVEILNVRIWIGGHPGADSVIARAMDVYGREIPQLPSPEAVIGTCPDLVAASERAWCEAVDADGIMVMVDEPSTIDTAATLAHCFSRASRQRFAREEGLASIPRTTDDSPPASGCMGRVLLSPGASIAEVARPGHDGRPLALCALGPGGTAREEAAADWRELGEVADVVIYAHQTRSQPAPSKHHWGYTRLGGMPQSWWEEWHDPLGSIGDASLAVADLRMQLALSGGHGVRIGSWAHLDGRLQAELQAWR